MYQILKQNKDRTKYIALSAFIITFLLLVTVAFKNDAEIKNKGVDISLQNQDLISIKKFLLKKINSPFINVNYEIKSGDSIQKILKKFKVRNNQIQTVINQYKKYSNPNKLSTGNKIDIVVEKDLSGKSNSITKFSVPITKSTTVEITRDERNNIISKKIITKLYKKKLSLKI